MLGFNRRFDPHIKKSKSLIKIRLVVLEYLKLQVEILAPPLKFIQHSGGLLDMTIHDFDIARF